MNAEEALQLLDELNASGAPFDEIDDGLLSSDIDVMSSEEEERLDDDIAGLLGDQEESLTFAPIICQQNITSITQYIFFLNLQQSIFPKRYRLLFDKMHH